MRFSLLLLFGVFTFASSCQERNARDLHKSTSQDSLLEIESQQEVLDKGQKLNFGFEDRPVIVWARIIGNKILHDQPQAHILGIAYNYASSGKIDTVYYETDNRDNLKVKAGEGIITLYPGNTTIVLNTDEGHRQVLFEVLEIANMEGGWKRIPTISFNDKGELASDFPVDVKCSLLQDSLVLGLRDDRGYTKKVYYIEDTTSCLNSSMSYIDRSNWRVYFMDKEAFMDPLK